LKVVSGQLSGRGEYGRVFIGAKRPDQFREGTVRRHIAKEIDGCPTYQ
jgi:hypothetical protein